MTSGRWLTVEEVIQTLWWQCVDVVVPHNLETSTVLLFTGGGSTNDNQILLDSMAIAQSVKTRSVVTYLSNITIGAVVSPDTYQYGPYEPKPPKKLD